MPEMSVIIVNWNGKQFLEECLCAMRRQAYRNFETILVDNGSSDDSVEYVRTNFPEVKLLTLPENRGFTGGNISAYRQAQGELIVLLNNDTEAHPRWLEEIHKASLLYPDAGSFASRMMYFDNRTRIENCGFDVGIEGTTVDLGRDEPEGPQWSAARAIFGACGGAVAYRRRMLEDVGFLDPDFFMVYEDLDLSFRAQLRGHRCIYVPTAIVFHRYRATLGTRPDRQVFYSQRNIEFVYFKNMPLVLMLLSAPQRLFYEIGAAIYFARLGAGAAFMRAKFDAIRHLPSLLRKRRHIQRGKTLENHQLRSLMKPTFFSKWKKLLSCLP
jgi:GT2 family glycosyltransferase